MNILYFITSIQNALLHFTSRGYGKCEQPYTKCNTARFVSGTHILVFASIDANLAHRQDDNAQRKLLQDRVCESNRSRCRVSSIPDAFEVPKGYNTFCYCDVRLK